MRILGNYADLHRHILSDAMNNIKRMIKNQYYFIFNNIIMLFLFLDHRKQVDRVHASVIGLSLDGLSAGEVLCFSANPSNN